LAKLKALEKYEYAKEYSILEPYQTWQHNFLFWAGKYLESKANTLSKRFVLPEDENKATQLQKQLLSTKTIEELRELVNALERIGFKSIQTYFNNFRCLYDTLSIKELEASTIQNITDEFMVYLFRETELSELSEPTKQNKKTVMKNFLEFIEKNNVGHKGEGAFHFNIDWKELAKEIKKEKKKVKILSPFDEYKKFVNAIDHFPFKPQYSVRNKLILKFLILSGIRISELTQLKQKNVNLKNKNIYIDVIGKGNKERTLTIELTPELKQLWVYYKKELLNDQPNTFFFHTTNKKAIDRKYIADLIKEVLLTLKINVTKPSPHMLRHSYACYAHFVGGIDIYLLRDLLGHEDISTTQLYLHKFNPNFEKAGNKIAKTLKQK